ncbi:MAG: MFS transporter [Egibacteraceae bacterium]
MLLPLRHRDWRLLAIGSLVSLLGDGFFLVAIVLQVLAISRNDPSAMGLVGLAWFGSAAVTYLIGGCVSDRFERRRVMIAADLVRAMVIGLMGLLAVTGRLQLWHVLVLGACFGAGNAFFNPASIAILPDLLPSEDLPKANAFLGFARPAMTYLAGPALGGFVVAASGKPGVAFLVDAGTFCFSAVMLALIRARPAADTGKQTSRNVIAEVREGLSFVRAHPWCWAYILGLGLSMLAWYGPVQVLLPYILKVDPGLGGLGLGESGAARQLGLILAFGGLGSMVVSAVVGERDDLPRRFITTMFLAEAIGILAVGVYGLMAQAWQAMIAALVVNGLFAVGQIYWATTLQRLVPSRLLGRVSSVDWLVCTALAPASFALAGTLSAAFSARSVILAGSLVGATAMVVLLRIPGVRDPEGPETGDAFSPTLEPEFHTAGIEMSSPAPQPPS